MDTNIEITTNFFPLAWTLNFVQPIIEIGNESYKKKWGTHTFSLTPGSHFVKIYFSYNGKPKSGLATITLHVSEGESIKISYYMYPFLRPSVKINKTLTP